GRTGRRHREGPARPSGGGGTRARLLVDHARVGQLAKRRTPLLSAGGLGRRGEGVRQNARRLAARRVSRGHRSTFALPRSSEPPGEGPPPSGTVFRREGLPDRVLAAERGRPAPAANQRGPRLPGSDRSRTWNARTP